MPGRTDYLLGDDRRALRRWKRIAIASLALSVAMGACGIGTRAYAGNVIGDLNGDGTVGILDLSILLANWGKTDVATVTPTPVASGNAINPAAYGAKGDGKTDDTAALQRALDGLKAGQSLEIAAGKTYVHTDVLRARVAGTTISGGGVILGTNGDLSALFIEANNITLSGFTHKVNATSRSSSWECNNITVKNPARTTVANTVIRNVTVDGGRCAGIFLDPAKNFSIVGTTVKNTYADGIHATNGTVGGNISDTSVIDVGDDGIACIAYARDSAPNSDITVSNTKVINNHWGRGYSAYGCNNMTYKNIYAENTSAASLIFGQEGSYDTYGSDNIKVMGATIVKANAGSPDHGAIFIGSDNPSRSTTNVTIQDVTIKDTYPHSRQIGLVGYGGRFSKILFHNITVTGGGNVYGGNAPDNVYNTVNVTYNGAKLHDHIGYSPF